MCIKLSWAVYKPAHGHVILKSCQSFRISVEAFVKFKNDRIILYPYIRASRFRESGSKTSYRLANRGPSTDP